MTRDELFARVAGTRPLWLMQLSAGLHLWLARQECLDGETQEASDLRLCRLAPRSQ